MRLALIGVGQAGGKIVDRFVEYDASLEAGFITSATAINTAATDLHGLDHVSRDRQVLIGEHRTKGHGVGADNEQGAEIAKEDRGEIVGALDGVPVSRTDAFLVVASLGGGTGSGAGPVIAQQLNEIHDEPVYGLGILPARDEGGIYTLNAARSFRTFVRDTDNLLVFDNDAWRVPGESIEKAYIVMNDEIVRRFGVLFGAGEIDRNEEVAETIVDSAEITNTLRCGGITTVGYATESIDHRSRGLLDRFREDGERRRSQPVNRLTSLVRKATNGRLTLPARVESVDRALILATGPPEALNRRGIERGRQWLEEETGSLEVRGGDYPLSGSSKVAVAILLAGVTDVPRIDDIQRSAVDVQNRFVQRDERRDKELSKLITDEYDELDPLY